VQAVGSDLGGLAAQFNDENALELYVYTVSGNKESEVFKA